MVSAQMRGPALFYFIFFSAPHGKNKKNNWNFLSDDIIILTLNKKKLFSRGLDNLSGRG